MRLAATLVVASLVVAAALAGPGLAAADEPLQAGYVVRPGDTLEALAARYLGNALAWEEIWKLNPEVADPHRIAPGLRLRLPLPEGLPKRTALIEKTSRRVEEQLTPHPWRDAAEQDLLRPRDALRTFDASSAELRFADDSRLVVTEQSLVFIDREARPIPVDTAIEVVVGQADLAAAGSADAGRSRIEVVLGDAVATSRAGAGARLEARLRRPQAGGAQLMVYDGESELEAGGGKVEVATGMGSVVGEKAAPSPPEALLPAPEATTPPAGSLWPAATPLEYRWSAVPGAVSYTLEVCADPACGRLIARRGGLVETSLVLAEGVGLGERYWRATATAPSGLDGYPSRPQAFRVDEVVDDVAPRVGIAFDGPSAWIEDHWVLGPEARLRVEAADDQSGVASVETRLDDSAAQGAAWAGPWPAGPHRAAVEVSDRGGNRASADFSFVSDPDPPALSWGLAGGAELGRLADDSSLEAAIAAGRGGSAATGRLLWPAGVPVAGCSDRDPLCHPRWSIRSDLAQVLVSPRRGAATLPAGGELTAERGLWILADDRPCRGPRELRLQIDAGERLLVEAVDCVGNRSRAALQLPR